MEISENAQKIINALRGYGVKTVNVIITKTLLSESIVLSELKQLSRSCFAETHRRFNLITYKLSKDKYNCRWSGHAPGSDFCFCIHPDVPEIDDETPCKNDRTCGKHRFLDEPDLEE